MLPLIYFYRIAPNFLSKAFLDPYISSIKASKLSQLLQNHSGMGCQKYSLFDRLATLDSILLLSEPSRDLGAFRRIYSIGQS
jgi:ABC-type sugar transport system ATPase subunit